MSVRYPACPCPACAAGAPELRSEAAAIAFTPTGTGAAPLLSGTRWGALDLTYGFTDRASDYGAEYAAGAAPDRDFGALGRHQVAAVRQVLDSYAAVCGLRFTENTDSADAPGGPATPGTADDDASADLRFGLSDAPSTAFAYFPAGTAEGGDVWFHNGVPSWATTAVYAVPRPGNYAWHTFVHEIGHAVGLKHGHAGFGGNGAVLQAAQDSMEFSVMTYRSYVGASLSGGYANEDWGYAQSLMVRDIAALQALYGANHATRSGDTVYSFSATTGEMFVDGAGQGRPGGNRIFCTIWDGGGTDWYDLGNYTRALSIDLTPGAASDFDALGAAQQARLGDRHLARGHVFNALMFRGDPGSLIENARGGSAGDSLSGNRAANRLEGAGGDDTLAGGVGADQLFGGAGADLMLGGAEGDRLAGEAGDDLLGGGSGDDVLKAGPGADRLYGGEGRDRLEGGAGADRLDGGTGDDHLQGGGDGDVLSGGAGADVFVFVAGSRADILTDFDPGADRIDLSAQGFGWAALDLRPLADGTVLVAGGVELRLRGVAVAELDAGNLLLDG